MHVAISWDIKTSQPKWDEVDQALKKCLDGYSWVRPLTTFYVVRISSETDRTSIREKLTSAAKAAGVSVHLLVSPAMAGGRYDGLLPSDTWSALNERTDP